MADAGLRRSEAAALVWGDVERARDGSGRLLIRRSKTDAEGAGAVVAITKRAMRDLKAIRNGAGDDAIRCSACARPPFTGVSRRLPARRAWATASGVTRGASAWLGG